MPDEFKILLQACGALVLGGALGWERESAGKWAGLRTHMLVCLAACLFVRLGQLLIADSAEGLSPGLLRADPTRLIEAIVTGVAFLGAGTIFRDRSAEKARGLTTAASLLLVATVGIAVALDRYVIAAGVTLLGLIVLRVIERLDRRIAPKSPDTDRFT
jgi:putative Mg2+ transporter-C (MgtC) family protein